MKRRIKWLFYAKILLGITLLMALCIEIYTFCKGENNEHRIAVIVNDVPIYCYEIERTLGLYPDGTLTYEAVLEAAVREELVVQEATKMGFCISDDELEKNIEDYKKTFPNIYEDLVDQYGSVAEFRQSYLYLLKYNYAKERKQEEYEKMCEHNDSFLVYFEKWVDSLEAVARVEYK